jgi:hypothetical protein
MSAKTKLGFSVLGTAAALGLLGDVLLRGALGLNAFLWTLLLAAGGLLIARRQQVLLSGNGRWFLIPAVCCTAAVAWRDAEALLVLDFLSLLVATGLAVRYARSGDVREGGFIEHGVGLVIAGAQAVAGPFYLVGSEIDWREVPRSRWSGQPAAVLRGLLIALPLLALFGALFMGADAVFAQLAHRVVSFNTEPVVSHVVLTVFWTGLAAGLLWTALQAKVAALPAMEKPAGLQLGATETGVVLGLLNALFLAFVLVQFRYFFGGSALVEATTGLTYADYARRGFFELVGVSALVLPLLLLLHWLAGNAQQRLFRWLAGALVAQLFVIMASAMQRMMLYQREFGLTEARLYATAFMGWLAMLFVWFGLTVMRGRRSRFVFGAVVSGFALLAALHAVSPDGLIARTNLARQAQGKPFDAAYAATLSADAAPLLVDALPRLAPEDQRVIAERLLERWGGPQQGDWRSWNWSRSRARQAVQAMDYALTAWAGESNSPGGRD